MVELLKRYFHVEVIGSYLFFEKGLLDEVNDIDILVNRDYIKQVVSFLEDNGYKRSNHSEHTYNHDKSSRVRRNKHYQLVKGGKTTVHLIQSDTDRVTDLPDIIKYKYERGTNTDLRQIIEICRNRLIDRGSKLDIYTPC
ncbi:MAG TPA: hypothetical protein VK031_06635 [Tissierellaceae bacterium]|nr:hypothetical protein [Tissierellaceae bacterium]